MTKARDLANASTALSAVSATELAFVDGVTSAIQTQMDAKASLTGTETLTNKTLTSPVLTTPTISTVNAKGDLLAGTADNTVDRLAVGNNGESLVADSSASTGLRYQGNYAAGKNKIINGAFDNWQRGTSFSGVAANTYTADRFLVGVSGTSTVNVTAQALPPAAITGYDSTYFFRYAISAIGTGNDFHITQRIENVQTLSNQVVNFSFWAKADSSRYVTLYMQQNFGSGGSTAVTTTGPGFTVTTSWVRYSGQVTLPSISGKTIGTSSHLMTQLYGSTTAGFTFDTWGWQLEAGSVATAFQTATGTLQGELAACQRYYWRQSGKSGDYSVVGNGFGGDTASFRMQIKNPVAMRTAPSSIDYSGLYGWDNANLLAMSSLALQFANETYSNFQSVGTSVVQYRPYALLLSYPNQYIGFSAEL